ncbi:MAG TPA: hypothetical protein VEN99_02555 [Acidimicrobiia bacterium]|nr:hypothetical protein [Acidimicrobiia bacterium]
MRIRVCAAVTAVVLALPVAAAASPGRPGAAGLRPDHTCTASTNLIEHQCPSPGTPPTKPSKPKK